MRNKHYPEITQRTSYDLRHDTFGISSTKILLCAEPSFHFLGVVKIFPLILSTNNMILHGEVSWFREHVAITVFGYEDKFKHWMNINVFESFSVLYFGAFAHYWYYN